MHGCTDERARNWCVSNAAHSYVCMSLCFFIQYLVWRAVVMYGGLPLLGGVVPAESVRTVGASVLSAMGC